MNIRCTNLNINDFSNLNTNQNANFDPNYQFFNYLQNQSNPNNLMFNQNPMIPKKYFIIIIFNKYILY